MFKNKKIIEEEIIDTTEDNQSDGAHVEETKNHEENREPKKKFKFGKWFFGLCVIAGIYYLHKLAKDSDPILNEEDVISESEIKREIINKLKEIENNIYFEYLSYSIYNETNKQRLDDQSISELKKEHPDYGRYLSYPVIDWNREFDFLGKNFYLLDPTIQEHLKKNNYKVDPAIILPNNFNNYLKAKAKKEAEAIVTKYLSNEKEG